ncbi:hypothetical protein AB7645_05545 [Bradyrhizobium sp. 956_D2_N1_5]|uniref:hypothetical protein n=1 Tax=unclassified Bradyrhizobium TaxID=2631580 RepID=UPI003F27343A
MTIPDSVSNAVARLWRGLKWGGRYLRTEKEEPVAAIRDWLKIIISGLVIVTLSVQARQLGIQGGQLATQGKQFDVQGEQLKVQGEQLKLQARQSEQATRAANMALATRLSAQRVDIENAQIKLGQLYQSFGDMMQLTTRGFVKGKELDPNEFARARDLIARVRKDADALEASTHALPFGAFQAVRKYHATAAIYAEKFARDLEDLPKDARLQAILNPNPAFIEMLKKDGALVPKALPRFADALSGMAREAFKDHFEAVKALIDAGKETETQWVEVERAIKAPSSNP